MKRPRNWRSRWPVWLMDAVLLPPALLVAIVEDVLWAGARAILRTAARWRPVRLLQMQLARLPPAAVLPLFLIPEAISHLGGLWATVLLVERHVVAAVVVAVLVKGTTTLLAVWIYQTCERTLLRVAWFARVHGAVMRARDWALAQIAPLRARLRLWVVHLRARTRQGSGRLFRRFRALRAVIAGRRN